MKRYVLSCLMLFGMGYGYAQNTDSLIGVEMSWGVGISAHVNLQSQAYQVADTVDGLKFLYSGEHCFDPINLRLFVHGSSGISVIDAISGQLLDSFIQGSFIHEIEYDPTANRIIGIIYTNPEWTFVSIDVASPALVHHDTLAGVTQFNGGATFDPLNHRYILRTNLGFTVINAQNGAIIDTIADPYGLNAIEFNPVSGKIAGMYWSPANQKEYYAELDPVTKVYTTLSVLNGITGMMGISTLDVFGQRYIALTTSGITVVNATNGAIIDTFPNSPTLAAFEYINPLLPNSLPELVSKPAISVYPNPALGYISLDGVEESGSYRIFDLTGRELARGVWESSSSIDISSLSPGMYWIFVEGSKAVPFVKE
ncbi:MAG: YncE family protein [Bacteroidia bacterium]